MRKSELYKDPREAMWQRLPRALQPLLSAITGKVALEEVEQFRHTTVTRLATTVSCFAIGIVGAMLMCQWGGIALAFLPEFWLMTAGAARAFQTTFLHHAAHGNLSRNKRLNHFFGDLASVLAWLLPLKDYAAAHRDHHRHLATGDDPDLDLLVNKLGFQPGRSQRENWRHLLLLLVNPRYHASAVMTRLNKNLIQATGFRRLASWAYLVSLLALTAITGMWIEFIVGYLVPIVILEEIAAVLQVVTEHTWVHLGQGQDSDRRVLSRLTRARFFADPLPDHEAPFVAYVWFWLRLFFVHLPLRILVVPSDLPSHDWHHAKPKAAKDWPRAAFARRDDERRVAAAGLPYSETWGLANAINLTFDHLALLPPNADLLIPASYGWIDPDLLSM